MLPINIPLLSDLTFRPFGQEERTSVYRIRAGNALAISCQPGRQPAGIVLTQSHAAWPHGAAGAVVLAARGDTGFQWGLAAVGHDPGAVYPLQQSPDNGRLSGRIDLSSAPAGTVGVDATIVLACPSEGGRIEVTDLRVMPRPVAVEGGLAAWVWQRGRWQDGGNELIADAARYKITRLYIALPIADGDVVDAAALRNFVARARGAGIDVWAVEGDPEMVTATGSELAIARLRAIGRYQRASTDQTRLGGIQYDIEPYQLPAYRPSPNAVMHAWGETVATLGHEADAPLDIVVPFWLPGAPGGDTVLSQIARAAHSLTVMAYRTDPLQVQRAATPLLAWGAALGFPVSVALEHGAMQDEWTQTYTPVPPHGAGTLWLLPADDRIVAMHFEHPATLKQGAAYVEQRMERSDAAKVSFLGDTDRLWAVSASLQPALRAWPNYAGVAFHGLLDR
ncbi:hypothetical protein [Burkholderia sp. BCC1988]|uniref:hypothetical protein n=1 Tax=Burkholderia sp. BCC1988 TaxID=2817443 RepID=UPI002AAF3994|nr:hypothetical protein [Burkholderia sp. BCC1988]